MSELSLAITVLLASSFLDGLRDGVWLRWYWLPRHAVKWAAFYTPLVYILISDVWPELSWYSLLLALPGVLLWQSAIRVVGVKWQSMWLKWLR